MKLSKSLKNRISIGLVLLAFFVLMDEYVKERYILDFHDFYMAFPTHEQLFIVFLILGLVMGLRAWE